MSIDVIRGGGRSFWGKKPLSIAVVARPGEWKRQGTNPLAGHVEKIAFYEADRFT